jgi:hypothetical protein
MKSISCDSFVKGSYMKMTTLQTEKWFPTGTFGLLYPAIILMLWLSEKRTRYAINH